MTTTTMTGAIALPASRLLGAYLAEARYESLRMLRAPAFAVPFLVLPVAVYLLFGVVMAGEAAADPAIANLLFCGFCTMAAIGPALFGMGCTLAQEREAGLLRLKRAMPVPPGAYLLSKVAMGMFFAALAMALMIATALLAGKITLTAGQLAALAVVQVLGSVPFCALGLFVGAHVSGGAAPALINLLYLPMLWLGGLFIPLKGLLAKLTVIWPAFHLNQLAVHAMGLEKGAFLPPQVAIAVLLALTVVLGGAAMHRLARRG